MAEWGDEEEFMRELRPAEKVAARCVVLCCVVAHQEDATLDFTGWLEREGLWASVTPLEGAFLRNARPGQRELRNFGWRSEALLTLMWCLGKVNALPAPVQTISFQELLSAIPEPDTPTRAFLESARLRSLQEVSAVYEQVYEQHWAVRDAEYRGMGRPAGLEPGVVYERHYALNWLRRYGVSEEQAWDDVTTDT